ncbi:hypothetical protein ANN_22045 [Periplaneta americana]|uniref:Uncharacterized protein n=1 Tax=Periplaneta americana TaxID=6978 RepID=A0ABQ8S7G7_PERAM|nr:hypothetical protein ANN_22045 [Periplaneta americana]
MAGLCEGGNEPSGSLKAIRKYSASSYDERVVQRMMTQNICMEISYVLRSSLKSCTPLYPRSLPHPRSFNRYFTNRGNFLRVFCSNCSQEVVFISLTVNMAKKNCITGTDIDEAIFDSSCSEAEDVIQEPKGQDISRERSESEEEEVQPVRKHLRPEAKIDQPPGNGTASSELTLYVHDVKIYRDLQGRFLKHGRSHSSKTRLLNRDRGLNLYAISKTKSTSGLRRN